MLLIYFSIEVILKKTKNYLITSISKINLYVVVGFSLFVVVFVTFLRSTFFQEKTYHEAKRASKLFPN